MDDDLSEFDGDVVEIVSGPLRLQALVGDLLLGVAQVANAWAIELFGAANHATDRDTFAAEASRAIETLTASDE